MPNGNTLVAPSVGDDVGGFILAFAGMPDLLPMQGRSEGVHISDIIKDLCVRLGHYSDEIELTSTWAQLGCALEDTVATRYERHFPDRYERPGELERDGLFGTPDLLDLEDGAIEEIKLSWMSAAHLPTSDKFWRYWVQVKAYCHMWGTPLCRLHVCHINGEYKQAGPIYRVWERTWTEQELERNWTMLLKHAARMGEREHDFLT